MLAFEVVLLGLVARIHGVPSLDFEFGSDLTMSWAEAESWCNDNRGAHLASIRNEEEFRAVAAACHDTACWGGLHMDEGGSWTWSDGTALAYGFEYCANCFPNKAAPHENVDPWKSDHPDSFGVEACTFISGDYCERYHENPAECDDFHSCKSHGEGGSCQYITTDGKLYDKECLEVDRGSGATLGIFDDGLSDWKFPQSLCAIKGMCRCFVLWT